jgi:hypothetical protein
MSHLRTRHDKQAHRIGQSTEGVSIFELLLLLLELASLKRVQAAHTRTQSQQEEDDSARRDPVEPVSDHHSVGGATLSSVFRSVLVLFFGVRLAGVFRSELY